MKTITSRNTPDFAPPADGRHDFNFIAGRWLVSNKRLVKRLQGTFTRPVYHPASC